MSDQDIFADKQEEVKEVQQQDSLSEALVGEGKKYATVDELAKAYYNADNFLETLKDENRTLREQVSKVADLDAAIERMQAKVSSASQDPEREVGEVPRNNLDANEIAKMVDERLAMVETTKTTTNNLKLADAKLKEVFGEEAKQVFDSIAVNATMRDSLTNLAKQNPDEFVSFFINVKGKNYTPSTPSTGVGGETKVNTVNLQSVHGNRVGDPETKEFYNELRKTKPSAYYSQEVQLKMNNAALKNPEKFYGNLR